MTEPSFSICIPNYNYGRFLGDTIRSVLDQGYQNFEIIVADNASTDNSVEVVNSFKDERIHLIRNRYNIGFAPNLQRATMFARNDFINLLSADDQMKPEALETYARAIATLGNDARRAVLFSDVEAFDDQGTITRWIRKARDGFYTETVLPVSGPGSDPEGAALRYEVYDGHEVLGDCLARLRTFAPFLSIVYHRELWEAVEGYNAVRTIGPDKHFNYKLLSLNPKVVYVPQVLYRYRDFLSDNRSSQYSTLKQVIDDYLYTLDISDECLRCAGVSRPQLIATFLNRICLKEALSQLGRRNYTAAFRLFTFAVASYPGITLRFPRAYLLMLLLGLGPASLLVAPCLYAGYKSTRTPGVGPFRRQAGAAS